jgi:hypothetical protein
MEEPKEEGTDKHPLALGNLESEAKHMVPADTYLLANQMPSFLPFKRWVNSFRAKKGYHFRQSSRYVEGWSDTTQARNNHLLCEGGQDLQWECLSGHSSNLETVKTSTLSIASQSIVRSRGTTQSTTNQSFSSDLRGSIESLRPVLSFATDEEAQSRAIKRRKVLREIITTESDYVFGLKALTNVHRAQPSKSIFRTLTD